MRRVHLKSLATEGGEFEGRGGSTANAAADLQVLGSTFEVKKPLKSLCDTVRVFVFQRVCFKLIMGCVGGAWRAVWTAQA